jgi:hypothetical protein
MVIFSKKILKVLSWTVFKEQFCNKKLDCGLKAVALINWRAPHDLMKKEEGNK